MPSSLSGLPQRREKGTREFYPLQRLSLSYILSSTTHTHTVVQTYLILLCFALLHFADTVFYKLRICGNPASSKPIGAIFPTAFFHFMSVCDVLVVLTILKLFYCYVCYGDP